MPIIDLNDCPCSGKYISTLVAPWILLTLHRHDGLHGYEIQKIILRQLHELGFGLNMGGLYRHLNQLEKRDVLASTWDTSAPGPARYHQKFCTRLRRRRNPRPIANAESASRNENICLHWTRFDSSK